MGESRQSERMTVVSGQSPIVGKNTGAKTMSEKIFVWLLATVLLATAPADAQQPRTYRVGVILPGGLWYETIDGLRVGLRQLGLEEGKQFNLVIRETKGDAHAAEQSARNLEQEKVNLIYTTASSVTIAARRATEDIPIVFAAGSDPVVLGLVDSFAKSGGRLTGVFYRDTDLIAKRLEILKEVVPRLHRAVTFYNPRNPIATESATIARAAARLLGVEFDERHFASVEELQTGVRALRRGEVDAYFGVSDAVTVVQDQLIIDTSRAKRLATMFIQQSSVIKGGLASYSVSFHEVGRLSAKYVQRVLTGVKPRDLPVQGVDKIELIINLKTAKDIGLTIPPNVLVRADKVIR
jgi:putative ABC transport system substrate-binding protein